MKIYTKTGDLGETGLIGGKRVPKYHPRIKACGDLDELNSALGWTLGAIKSEAKLAALISPLERIQNRLFELGAVVASEKEKEEIHLEGAVFELEKDIDEMTESLETLKNFILPGGSEIASRLFFSRAICRRAERSLCEIEEQSPSIRSAVVCLNRLSDYLFTAARWANKVLKEPETIWKGVK